MRASIIKYDSRTRDKVLYGVGYQDFSSAGECSDTRSNVNGDACQLWPKNLALTGVKTRTNIEAHQSGLVDDGSRRPNCPSRAIERGEEPVARSIDFSTTKCRQFATDHCMMAVEKFPPPAIAECHSMCRGADHVGEEHRGQYPIVAGMANASEERFDCSSNASMSPAVGA